MPEVMEKERSHFQEGEKPQEKELDQLEGGHLHKQDQEQEQRVGTGDTFPSQAHEGPGLTAGEQRRE